MRNPFSYLLPIKTFTFFTALFVSVLLLYIGYYNTDFELLKLKKLIISQATTDGISVQSRIDLFYGLIFKLVILLVVHLALFSFLFKRIKIRKQQSRVLLLLSSVGISLVFIQIIGVESETLIYLLFFLLVYKVIVYGLGNSSIKPLKIVKAEVWSNSILAYGFLIYFALLYLTGSDFFLIRYILSVVVLSLIYIALKYFTKLSSRKLNYLFVPLTFFSLLGFLSVELVIFQYQKELDLIGYRKLYLLLFAFCSAMFYCFVYFKRKPFKNTSFIFKRYLAPSVIITFCLLIYYFPIVQQNTELFELGNPANAIMRIFKFNEIPFVDFMSSHMFSEQWYGIIYSILFGYNNDLDFEVYAFFNRLLFLLVVYFSLNRLFNNPAFSLLFVFTFPFLTQVFSADLILCILPFFVIQQLTIKSSSKRYFILFALLIVLIIWKIDVGYAALLSSFFYLLFLAITYSISIHWKHLIKGFFITASVIIGLLLLAVFLKGGEYIFENFKTALHYVSGNQAHGYSEIAYSYPHQFYISYFFLPFISVLSVVYIGYLLWKKTEEFSVERNDRLILHAALFFFLISLSNAQRGLVRHGYAEHNDGAIVTTFYLALALLIIFLTRNYVLKNRFTLFYIACFSLFLIFRFFPYQPAYGNFDKAIKKNAFLELNVDMVPKTELRRTQPDQRFYTNQLEDFKRFLADNLSKEETFLDFSNSPMLYYYSGRSVPGYFCQNLQNSIDDYSQLRLLSELHPKKAPVVVFSSYPANWFDATDGIPNSMRYYLIAEYIYQNYKPYAIMSGKRIWIAKDFNVKDDFLPVKDTVSKVPLEFNYKKAAHFIYDFYKRNGFEDLEKLKEWRNQLENVIPISNNAPGAPHAYLCIEFEEGFKTASPRLILRDSLGNNLDLFKFEINKALGNTYMIRVSNSYHWHNGNIDFIELEREQSIHVKSITLFKDTRFED